MARVVDRDFEKAAEHISNALLVGYQHNFDYSALLFQLGENNHQQVLSMINSPVQTKESLEKLQQYLDLLRFIAKFSQPYEPIEPTSQHLALLTEHVLIPPSLSTFLLSLSKQIENSSDEKHQGSIKTNIAQIRQNLSQLINTEQYTTYIATIDEVSLKVEELLAQNAALNQKYRLEDQCQIGKQTYFAILDEGYSSRIQSQIDRISQAYGALQAFAIKESTISNQQLSLAVERKINTHHKALTQFKELSEILTKALEYLQSRTFDREDSSDKVRLHVISKARQIYWEIIDSTEFKLTQQNDKSVFANTLPSQLIAAETN